MQWLLEAPETYFDSFPVYSELINPSLSGIFVVLDTLSFVENKEAIYTSYLAC
jgi:hypothetical protein